jgi:putative hydrolase of the HAD superfamily
VSDFDAVLWDYGGVFTASPFAAAHAYARAQDADPEVMVQIVFGSYDTDSDHAWHRLERGELTFADALAVISADARAAGMRFDTGEMFNNIREYGDAWRARLAIDELFDLVVDSCEEGVRKPDPAIFHTALDRLGVDDPRRAVFLDDFEGNLVAAREIGMHGILVGPDPRPALAELAALLD